MSDNERQLLDAARRGDREAMEALFRLYVDRSVRLAYLIIRDWAAAEDTVQEAFIRAFRSLHTIRDDGAFGPWFTKIVVNRARTAVQRRRYTLPMDTAEGMVSAGRSPEEAALLKEGRDALWDAVIALDQKYRLPIQLKYFTELSEAETAAVLDLPLSTVKSRLYVARQQLKKALAGVTGGLTQYGER